MGCFFLDKTYLIFGTGTTGRAGCLFCEKHKLNYFVADDKENNLRNLQIDCINIDENKKLYIYNEEVLKEKKIDFLLLSPSIHSQIDKHQIVVLAEKLGIEIIADVDLFYSYLQEYNKMHNTNKKLIGITGTNGKSTTTALTAFLLNKCNTKAIDCGNIAGSDISKNPLCIDVEKYDYFVVEMSSYNLFLMKYAKFFVGILLNITEDHLAYHGTMENYSNAKKKLLENSEQKVICIDDNYTKSISTELQCVKISTNGEENADFYWQDGVFYHQDDVIFEGTFENLIGKHNIENIFSAVVCVKNVLEKDGFNIELDDIFEKVKDFQGLKHRIQFIKIVNNIAFYNDSKGTNADSTQKALQSFVNTDIYLIAGGQRKTAGFLFLKNDLHNVKCVFLIGEAIESFAKELTDLQVKYVKCQTMDNAVKQAYKKALDDKNNTASDCKKVILLSPLCASWDQYKSYEDRGDDFINIVNGLK